MAFVPRRSARIQGLVQAMASKVQPPATAGVKKCSNTRTRPAASKRLHPAAPVISRSRPAAPKRPSTDLHGELPSGSGNTKPAKRARKEVIKSSDEDPKVEVRLSCPLSDKASLASISARSIKTSGQQRDNRATRAARRAEQPGKPEMQPPSQRATKRRRAANDIPGSPATSATESASVSEDQPQAKKCSLFAFGCGPFGALGLGEGEDTKQRPAQVLPDNEFVDVAAGGMHTVTLDAKGQMHSSGVNDEGSLGRCTSGTCWEQPEGQREAAMYNYMKGDSSVLEPIVMPPGVDFMKVVAGDGFTFALATDGSVWGCGMFKDDVGPSQGFSGSLPLARTLVRVYSPEGNEANRAVQLAAGARHCALLTKGGAVLTWGIGSQSQLGRLPAFNAEAPPARDLLFTPAPVSIPGALLGGSTIDRIDTGSYCTFVTTKAGHVIAWGLNNSGQLGFAKESESANFVWSPVLVPSLAHVASVKGGEHHTLFAMRDGTVRSCGAPTYGMLGRSGLASSQASATYPVPEPVEGLSEVVSVAAGTNVSACVTRSGQLMLWGSNVNYQLAKGDDEEDDDVPRQFKRTKTFGFRPIHQVVFGGQHAVLLAGPVDPAMAQAAAAARAVVV